MTPELEALGYVPNYKNIRPGDVLLYQRIVPNGTSRIVHVGQANQRNNTWYHAAICIAQWRIVEARVVNNVSNDVLTRCVHNHRILVRRPRMFTEISEDQAEILGLKIAVEAAMHQGIAKYGIRAAISTKLRLSKQWRRRVKSNSGPELNPESIICSGLYARCYNLATGKFIQTVEDLRTAEPITPAFLVGTSQLMDVKVGWLRLT